MSSNIFTQSEEDLKLQIQHHSQLITEKCKTEKNLKQFLLPDHRQMTNYIKNKLNQASNKIFQTKSCRNLSQRNLISLHNPRAFLEDQQRIDKSKFLPNHWKQSQIIKISSIDFPSISGIQNDTMTVNNLTSDQINNKKHNKIINYESKFERMIDNYQKLESMRKQQADTLYQKMTKSPQLQELQTRPDTLEEIQLQNQDFYEPIIRKQSLYKQRSQQVMINLHKNSQNKWKNLYLPSSYQERKEKNQLFFYQKQLTPIRNQEQQDNQSNDNQQWRI